MRLGVYLTLQRFNIALPGPQQASDFVSEAQSPTGSRMGAEMLQHHHRFARVARAHAREHPLGLGEPSAPARVDGRL